jgi:hypothetical protein
LLQTYYRGGLNFTQLKEAIRYNGIDVAGLPGQTNLANVWNNIIAKSVPNLPFDMAWRQNVLGQFSDVKLRKMLARLGFPGTDEQKVLMDDTNPLDLAFILELYDRDVIDRMTAELYLRHAGYANTDFVDLLFQTSTGIDPMTAMVLLNRGVFETDDVEYYQKWSGIRNDDARKDQLELRWQWPTVAQVTQWSQLGTLDPVRVQSLGLDQEQPDSYLSFGRAAGQHWTAADEPPQNWPLSDLTPAMLNWRAHWRPNDAGTAITMLHRLRDDGTGRGMSIVPGVPAYTSSDFDADLAAMGIPPGRREQYKATTYSLPRFTIFRTALQAGTVSESNVVSRLQDAGYDADTSQLLVNTWAHTNLQRQIDKLRPISRSAVTDAYKLGTITRTQAAIGLYIVYLTDFAQIQQFLSLPIDAQANEASSNGFVQIALTSIDAEIAGELAKQAVEVVRKGYLRLEIDASQAVSQLALLGIVPNRATQYVQLWTYEHAAEGVEANAGQLRDWYQNHIIDQPTYSARLTLLGYSPGDIALMIARANLDISEKAASLQAKTVRAQQMQQKQLVAAQKALAAQQRQVQKLLCSSATRAQVLTFAMKKLITMPDAHTRLMQCGMSSDDAVAALAAKLKLEGPEGVKQIESEVGPQPSPSGTNGSSAGS